MAYDYSLVKFVPDAARGEVVNLGAIAGSDETGDWEFRAISNFVRARALDDKNALPGALAFISEIEDRIASLEMLTPAAAPMSSNLLARWSFEMRNIVQFSMPAPLVAASAAEALDLVFDQLIVDPGRREFRFEKKHRAISSTVAAYRRTGVPDEAIVRKILVRADRFTDSFDLGVANGRLIQVVKCWSFQLPAQAELAEQVKAWAWLVERVRDAGAIASVGDRTYEMPRGESDISVVYIPPADQQEPPAFTEALAAFETLGVEAVEAERAVTVARRAAEHFRSTSTSRSLW